MTGSGRATLFAGACVLWCNGGVERGEVGGKGGEGKGVVVVGAKSAESG